MRDGIAPTLALEFPPVGWAPGLRIEAGAGGCRCWSGGWRHKPRHKMPAKPRRCWACERLGIHRPI
ncbi:hypothetical protein LUZ100_gp56 [Pseudomonas phage LUZ100]|nr:hypothetical protein LUZ100_gp56 [Pseudomonas phage LUZ100]